jgi:hypothetical protein
MGVLETEPGLLPLLLGAAAMGLNSVGGLVFGKVVGGRPVRFIYRDREPGVFRFAVLVSGAFSLFLIGFAIYAMVID